MTFSDLEGRNIRYVA